MSREALNYVLKRSSTEGCRRLVMISLALNCPKEGVPFLVRVPASKVAKDANITVRYAQELLKDLDAAGEIGLLVAGVGRAPNLYEIHPVVTCPSS